MLLSDNEIESYLKTHSMIEPWSPRNIQPASYDVTLGEEFIIDDKKHRLQTVIMKPQGFLLGTTVETIRIPDMLYSRFEGKSSLGRLGLMTHVTAGFIDPGFHGQITVELHNVSSRDVWLHAGMLIGQLCFGTLSSRVRHPYGSLELGSHYQDQQGPTQAHVGVRREIYG